VSLSFHNLALDGIVADIQSLTLTGLPPAGNPLPSTHVAKMLLTRDLNVPLPFVAVTLAPMPETLEGRSSGTDDIGYPCAVVILIAKNQSLVIEDPDLYWRQQIMDLLHFQSTPGLNTAIGSRFQYTRWEPGTIIDPQLWSDANVLASAMIIRAIVRKTRPR
jgi:hypothetical protein